MSAVKTSVTLSRYNIDDSVDEVVEVKVEEGGNIAIKTQGRTMRISELMWPDVATAVSELLNQ